MRISLLVCGVFLMCLCGAVTTTPYPPTMTKQPPHEQFFQVSHTQDELDEPFILECESEGDPEPKYRWIKNGKPFDFSVEAGRVTQQLNKGTLVVNTPLDSDEGIYQCFAENIHGTSVSSAVHLRKSELNSFPDEEPKEIVVMEGRPLSLSCKTPIGNPRPNILWILQTKTGALQGVNNSRIIADPEGGLHFTNVTMDDALEDAQYICSATSLFRVEYKLGCKTMLKVVPADSSTKNEVSPTKLYVSPANIVVLRDMKLRLSCIFGGTPLPQIMWSKQGKSLQNSRITYKNNGKTLEIQKADFQDEGTYVCTASNGIGTSMSHSIDVTIQAAPYWIKAPSNTNSAGNDTVTFECVAGGIPAPEVEWLMNGVPMKDVKLNPRRRLDTSKNILTIEALKKSDTAVFQCNASNIHGYVFRNFYLNVLDTPNPPKIEVQCDGLTALVRWQPNGDRSSPILSYTIQFSTGFTPDKWEDVSRNIPAANTSFQISMTPGAKYTFRVIATNKFGPSEPSGHSNICETPTNVPYKNPDNVTGKGTKKDNLIISWTSMPMIEQNSPGFFYKVFWKREDIPLEPWNVTEIFEWERNSFRIPNQPTFKPYRIKVEAHNSRGQAHTSATEVIGYSGEDAPLEAPKNFRLLYVKDGSSAGFVWDPVSLESVRGHFRGYKIQSWTMEEGEERLREQVIKENVTKALVTILRPFSHNFLRVLAFNDIDDGPPSDFLQMLTREETPGPVAYFDATSLRSDALRLVWKPPYWTNGILTGYNIYFREAKSTELGEEQALQVLDPHKTEAILTGLKPKTKYRIDIYATTSMGEGKKMYIEAQTSD